MLCSAGTSCFTVLITSCNVVLRRYIVFHCVDYEWFGSNDSLGQVIIDLKDFDPEQNLSGTFRLADLVIQHTVTLCDLFL